MNRPLYFSFPGNESLAQRICTAIDGEVGEWEVREFPDGETYTRFHTPVAGRDIVFFAPLDHPNAKFLPLYFAAQIARENGAARLGLVIPYLPYMRQDAVFKPGEGISSGHFARLLSQCCDWFVTVDPHLHRHKSLDEIYTCKTTVIPAAPVVAEWIRASIAHPVIVGPDEESAQWAQHVAQLVGCEAIVLRKERRGDRDVTVSMTQDLDMSAMTPVLVDDIVSTARTLRSATLQLHQHGAKPPVCIGVHALFAGDAHAALYTAGVESIVSCNTVMHTSNRIDLSGVIAEAVKSFLV